MNNCERHKIRKRKDCPECFPDVKGDMPVKVPKATKIYKKEEKVDETPIQTSREMRANLDAMEKEEQNLAIKAPRAERKKPEPKVEAIFDVTSEDIPINLFEEFEAKLNAIADRVYNRLLERIDIINDIRYEHLKVPVDVLSMAIIDNLEKEGWRWCHYYDEIWNKASGLNVKHHHLFQRIINSKNPAKPDLNKSDVLTKYTK